jgi:hypothetical protein
MLCYDIRAVVHSIVKSFPNEGAVKPVGRTNAFCSSYTDSVHLSCYSLYARLHSTLSGLLVAGQTFRNGNSSHLMEIEGRGGHPCWS